MKLMVLNMAQTLAFAIILLVIGRKIKDKVNFFQKYFIPAPVIGGVIFSILTLIGHNMQLFEFKFDNTLKDLLMIAFFTTIGFSASIKTLKQGGVQVFTFLATATVLVIIQNYLGVIMAKFFGLNPLIGLAAGSVPLSGGHGTAGAFGPVLEAAGATGAFSVAIASATFGLVAGCAIGGPVAKKLLAKHNLKCEVKNGENGEILEGTVDPISENSMFEAIILVSVSMGLGSLVGVALKGTKIVLPVYIGSMLIAAVIRNIMDSQKREIPKAELDIIGSISLSIFLSMALMTLALWDLSALAGPLLIMLLVQTAITGLYAYFITFNIMGRDYDAVAISAGHCGFGLGATPNAMANMEAFTAKNGPSIKAFFVLPIVGAMFIDFTNAAVITFFMNILK
ncbi:MAG: sodium/glutamate symporter [Fusobacteriaceae bacterium]